MKIQKSIFPENRMDINTWYETFNVASRCEKYIRSTGDHLNDQYNFNKLKEQDSKMSIINFFKKFKLIDL
jgi:hypothetical protein